MCTRILYVFLVGLLLVARSACSSPGAPTDAACDDGDLDADAGATLPDADAVPDSGTCQPTPGADATPGVVVELPPEGDLELRGAVNHGRYVVYSEPRNNNGDPYNSEVFLYDLELNTEVQLTDDTIQVQWDPYLWGNEIMWSNGEPPVGPSVGTTVTRYDISTGAATQLGYAVTDYARYFRFNQDHLVYISQVGVPAQEEGRSVWLEDRHSGETVQLCAFSDLCETYSMGDRYPAWVAYDPAGDYTSKDVFYYDVDARQAIRIETTAPGSQWYPIHAGDYIFWEDNRDGDWNIYRYHLPTGVEERLTWDSNDQAFPQARGHLLTWLDYRWSCERYLAGNTVRDMVIHDVNTGVTRRVTSASDHWKNRWADDSWFVYVKLTGYRAFKIYAHDLVADGILDAPDGQVLPGGASIDP